MEFSQPRPHGFFLRSRCRHRVPSSVRGRGASCAVRCGSSKILLAVLDSLDLCHSHSLFRKKKECRDSFSTAVPSSFRSASAEFSQLCHQVCSEFFRRASAGPGSSFPFVEHWPVAMFQSEDAVMIKGSLWSLVFFPAHHKPAGLPCEGFSSPAKKPWPKFGLSFSCQS